MSVLVDSSVLLDVMTQDPRWAARFEEKLAWHAERDLLAINPIIYAEVSVHFASIEELDDALSPSNFIRLPLRYEAGYLAAKCFLQYRRRGGRRSAPLPDFYIGAHAATESLALLTRDVARYRTYFPTIQLIVPNGKSYGPEVKESGVRAHRGRIEFPGVEVAADLSAEGAR